MTLTRLYGNARTRIAATTAFLIYGVLAAPAAFAAGSSMPSEAPLQTTGLALAFGDTSGGFRKLIQIVFGLSIAFAASSFFLSFFSFGGGALIA